MRASITTTEVQSKRSITSSSAIICPQIGCHPNSSTPGLNVGGGGAPNCQSRRRRRRPFCRRRWRPAYGSREKELRVGSLQGKDRRLSGISAGCDVCD